MHNWDYSHKILPEPHLKKKEESLGVEACAHARNHWAAKWQRQDVNLCLPFASVRGQPPAQCCFTWGILKKRDILKIPTSRSLWWGKSWVGDHSSMLIFWLVVLISLQRHVLSWILNAKVKSLYSIQLEMGSQLRFSSEVFQ